MEDKAKTGPKPKELVEGTIKGLCVGRDKRIVPPDQVQELAALGCSNTDIANFFGVTEQTIRYNFSEYITKGKEELKITLRRAMLKNATGHMNAAVQIFLAKNILGMTSEPMSSEANAPLPWNESEEADVDIQEYEEETTDEENQ